MWILPSNYQLSSRFAQGFLASKEDLNLPDLNIESSLTSKSKPMRLPTCLRKWKRDYWFRRLCLATLKPCQWNAFETEFTSLHLAIHASHFRQQDSEKEQMIQDTSGLTSKKSSEQFDLFDASSRMLKDTSVSDSEKSLQTWKASVISQRGEYSQRVRLALLTRESESTFWPTPAARDYKGAVLPETLAAKNRNPMTNSLPDAIQHKSGSGSPNPIFVEWLMGLPTGWTELGCWGTE